MIGRRGRSGETWGWVVRWGFIVLDFGEAYAGWTGLGRWCGGIGEGGGGNMGRKKGVGGWYQGREVVKACE